MNQPMASSRALLCFVLVCLVAAVRPARSAVPCNQVINFLEPCIDYVLYGGTVLDECCKGVRDVYSAAQTTADRQQICSCIKSVSGGVPANGAISRNVASIPSKCGLNLPYKISPSTDCKSVK